MREGAYRIYITDMLYYQARGQSLTIRYDDMIHPKPQDTRTAEEIADDIITKFGLTRKDGE